MGPVAAAPTRIATPAPPKSASPTRARRAPGRGVTGALGLSETTPGPQRPPRLRSSRPQPESGGLEDRGVHLELGQACGRWHPRIRVPARHLVVEAPRGEELIRVRSEEHTS